MLSYTFREMLTVILISIETKSLPGLARTLWSETQLSDSVCTIPEGSK